MIKIDDGNIFDVYKVVMIFQLYKNFFFYQHTIDIPRFDDMSNGYIIE